MAKDDDKPKNMVEEVDKEVEDAEKDGASSRKNGGKVKRARGGGLDAAMEHKTSKIARKSGGKVPGKAAMSRPDRRARGGSVSDLNPMTSAGNVSEPDYVGGGAASNGGGKGGDMTPYKGGSRRRPG